MWLAVAADEVLKKVTTAKTLFLRQTERLFCMNRGDRSDQRLSQPSRMLWPAVARP